MSNDNMAYYVDEISYPMVAMLLAKEEITFDDDLLPYFKDVKWKDLNQRNKNNYMKSVAQFLVTLGDKSLADRIEHEAKRIFADLKKKKLKKLGEKKTPPKAY